MLQVVESFIIVRPVETITLEARDENLMRLLSWVELHIHAVLADCELAAALVAVEEVFTNIAHYGYAAGMAGNVELDLERLDAPGTYVRTLELRFTDSGLPFNPLEYKYDFQKQDGVFQTLEERRIGGAGILLYRDWADECEYKRDGGKNILTLRKSYIDKAGK
jgi:sigma-B regulation protein RsbU (phosphoserine phosphatase)